MSLYHPPLHHVPSSLTQHGMYHMVCTTCTHCALSPPSAPTRRVHKTTLCKQNPPPAPHMFTSHTHHACARPAAQTAWGSAPSWWLHASNPSTQGPLPCPPAPSSYSSPPPVGPPGVHHPKPPQSCVGCFLLLYWQGGVLLLRSLLHLPDHVRLLIPGVVRGGGGVGSTGGWGGVYRKGGGVRGIECTCGCVHVGV